MSRVSSGNQDLPSVASTSSLCTGCPFWSWYKPGWLSGAWLLFQCLLWFSSNSLSTAHLTACLSWSSGLLLYGSLLFPDLLLISWALSKREYCLGPPTLFSLSWPCHSSLEMFLPFFFLTFVLGNYKELKMWVFQISRSVTSLNQMILPFIISFVAIHRKLCHCQESHHQNFNDGHTHGLPKLLFLYLHWKHAFDLTDFWYYHFFLVNLSISLSYNHPFIFISKAPAPFPPQLDKHWSCLNPVFCFYLPEQLNMLRKTTQCITFPF